MVKKSISYVMLFAALGWSTALSAQTIDQKKTSEKFSTLLYYIEQMYVDSVDSETLVETAIVGMLEELDPHSSYISAADVQEANAPLKGNFDGIGIQFNILKDTILVVSPISGGPSEKLGIQAGDKIVIIDGENVAGVGVSNNDVRDKLMGPKDTKVTVGIKRKGSKKLLEFEIIRDKIPIFSVDASYMVDDEIGYVKVNRFGKTTMQELREALMKMKSQGMKDLILDLQGNGGGYLQTAIDMADEFLSEQKLIVFTQGRSFPKDDFYARREGLFEKGRLVVLIDEGSASASEIVSGAIQDWDRGLIVGRRSFGKGLVQRPVPLPDGAEVRLTVQKYYTPSGRCIQKPYDEGVEAYRNEKYDRYENGELYSMDNIDLPDSLKFETNVKKRTVYGGGGILPDIFVPVDTSMTTDYFMDLIRTGIMNRFALEYTNEHRKEMMDVFNTPATFRDNFVVTEDIKKELIALAESEELEFNEEEWNTSKEAIEIRLAALIGRNLYDYNLFFEIINELSPAYQKAIKTLKDGTFEKANLAHRDF